MKIIPDTNVLMEGIDFNLYDDVVILPSVLGELDSLNHKDDKEVAYKARKAIKQLNEALLDNYKVHIPNYDYCDLVKPIYFGNGDITFIDDICKVEKLYGEDEYVVLTYDLMLSTILNHLKINNQLLHKKPKEIYKGYREIIMTDEEMAEIYENPYKNLGLLKNEYLAVKNTNGEVVDCLRWDGTKLCPLNYSKINSMYLDTVTPLADDFTQKFAFDSLFSDRITVLYGRAGNGKTYLSLAYAMQQLSNRKIDKLYIAYQFVPLKNSKTLGYLPGDKYEKILGQGIGNILATKLGGVFAVRQLIEENKIEILPTSEIRGVEIGSRDMLYMTEAQNTDGYTMKTLLQRCKEGCKIIIEGDMLEQVDINVDDNGMKKMIDVFKGSEYFSCVKLKNNHRNPISNIAENII